MRPKKVNVKPWCLLQLRYPTALSTQRCEAAKSICMPFSSSASDSEGAADWDSSEEEEKKKAKSAVQERKTNLNWRVAGRVERVGAVQRRTWEEKRRRRVQKGVEGQLYTGVLLRVRGRRGGRRHSHSLAVWSYHATIGCSLNDRNDPKASFALS